MKNKIMTDLNLAEIILKKSTPLMWQGETNTEYCLLQLFPSKTCSERSDGQLNVHY